MSPQHGGAQESPSVSVAMATYNGERFLRRQLESLAWQSRAPAELVVTDDCSTDGTLAVLEAFARTAPFPVLVRRNEKRLGYGGNFLRAASLCRGDLIALCDQDDVWYPRKLEICAKVFVPGVLLAYHDADVVDVHERKYRTLRHHVPFTRARRYGLCPPLSYVLGFRQVFRRSLLDFAEFWPLSLDPNRPHERMAHDVWFFVLASSLGGVVHVPELLAAYRQHESNVCGLFQVSRGGAWIRSLRGRDARLAAQALAAESVAAVFEAAAARPGAVAGRPSTMASRYRRYAWICSGRARLYGATRLPERWAAFLDLNRRAFYGWRDWPDSSVGSRTAAGAFLEDLALGVPFAPTVSRWGNRLRGLRQRHGSRNDASTVAPVHSAHQPETLRRPI